jgi:hypothetical protein
MGLAIELGRSSFWFPDRARHCSALLITVAGCRSWESSGPGDVEIGKGGLWTFELASDIAQDIAQVNLGGPCSFTLPLLWENKAFA